MEMLLPMPSDPSSCQIFNRYDAVIFDFEGTLVDFQWNLGLAEEELRCGFARLGFVGDEFTKGNYANMWNVAAARYGPLGRIAELRDVFYPIYDRWDSDALTRWILRPDATNTLQSLLAGRVRIGMVSNIGRKALSAALGRFDLAGLFSMVVSRDDVTYMKPGPEGILRVLSDWGTEASSAIFVGDSLADVRGARAADVPVAIIRGGEVEETAFSNDRPDHMISGLSEIIELTRTWGM